MATYFEGFKTKSDGHIQFHHKPQSRRTLFRQALSQDRHLKLTEMLGSDAGKLINSNASKALLFYAQCWALHYFLRNTTNPKYRTGFAKFMERVGRGNKPSLEKELGVTLDQLEKDFLAFIREQ